MKRAYFFETKLETGDYVNIVYETEHRKGTHSHMSDLLWAIYENKIKVADDKIKRGKRWKDTFYFIYMLNDKNKYEECFDDRRTINLCKEK